ncbi:phenylalanine--tRNA ligase subunit beta [Sphingomonas sp. RG327]|uniref:Phenylalanine--tRNA ligase beta subunit n=1 Tax=Sphingomonas anseongensis TaxID=2908207 RepID=A0ABT0RGJ5_9SPHN|nr:phenylalanine--tRNA ligase subunit beta [Sphingomonas anseongensis]MCL6679384.1 phenylalanine--tRNA ligase subunit beta [Sphingomonas anseongensis]
MKFSLSWLKAHLDTDASAEEIAERLTNIGLEVEEVSNPAEALAPFKVAKVLTAARHPQADKLQVLTVDAGDGPIQVVCGAPNARAGLLGVFGPPGAYVPGSAMTLKVAAIRGVESHGMMCSVRELELGEEHDGIIELAADAPVGAAFADYAELNDPVFDVAITPDRADCMGVRGIARDLAAAGVGTLKPLHVPKIEGSFAPPIEIRIEDPEGCPAFYGRAIRGLANGHSPEWIQRRLKSAGQRPISAIVDITNYVMLDLGRPSHAYDVAKLDHALVARRAHEGETLLALNEKEYSLDPTMTVIADESRVHDIGGIMGGEHSGVSEDTTDVMLEVAYFDPSRIAQTGQKLALTSDARSRFERGVDPAFLADGLDILTQLILDTCGGEASQAQLVGEPPVAAKTLPFDPDRTLSLGAVEVAEDRQRAILLSLGFEFEGAASVRVPSWRPDVDGPADLVEEVIRIVGYDQIPSTPLEREPGVARPTATRSQLVERRARRAAAARGLDEAVTWSFISEEEAAHFDPAWRLDNPISEDMKVMRPSLLPGLVAAAARNMARGSSSIRLFEIGRRYLAEGERPTLAFVLAGNRQVRNWQSGKAKPFDAFDAKAVVLAILEAAGAPVASHQVFPDAGSNWHPGRSAKLGLGAKTILASLGEPHPALARALDAPEGLVAGEIYLDAIPEPRSAGRTRPQFAPAALQPVSRDFAFLVPADLPADNLARALRGADKNAITQVRLFDRFESADGLSLAFEVTLQPADKSFTDEEIAAISKAIVASAEKLGAKLRSN